jgi:hypothetical protein
MTVDMPVAPFICCLVRNEVGPAFVLSQMYTSPVRPFRLHYDAHRILFALTYCIPMTMQPLSIFRIYLRTSPTSWYLGSVSTKPCSLNRTTDVRNGQAMCCYPLLVLLS